VPHPEIEDLLRDTLVGLAKTVFGRDVAATSTKQPARPIVDILAEGVPDFSKYKLAKAFLRWSREHSAADLTSEERAQWKTLIQTINKVLK
jgi:hypothetical protein